MRGCRGVWDVACGAWDKRSRRCGRWDAKVFTRRWLSQRSDTLSGVPRRPASCQRLVVCAQRWLSHPMAGKMQQDPATERASPTDGSPCTGRRRCHIGACHLRDQESVQWTLLGVALFFWCSLGGSLGGCFGWLFECGSPHMVKLAAIDVHLKRQPKLMTKKSERVHHDMLESRPSTTT